MDDLIDDPGLESAMASLCDEPTHTQLISAAIQFLRSGASLHKVRVNGEMLNREQVAKGLERYIPTPIRSTVNSLGPHT